MEPIEATHIVVISFVIVIFTLICLTIIPNILKMIKEGDDIVNKW